MLRRKRNIEKMLDHKKVLPENLVIKSAGVHLFKLGITDQYVYSGYYWKRDKIHSPFIIFIVQFIIDIRCLISVYHYNIYSEDLFFYLGDFSAFIPGVRSVRVHFDIAIILFVSISTISQFIHLLYSYYGIIYSWFKPFQMMAGMISPAKIGIFC